MADLLVEGVLADGHLEEGAHASVLVADALLAGVLLVVVQVENRLRGVRNDADGEWNVAAVVSYVVAIHVLKRNVDALLKEGIPSVEARGSEWLTSSRLMGTDVKRVDF